MTSSDTVREQQAMHQVTDRLVATFAGTYPPQQVAEKVTTVHQIFDGRPIRDFVPILVERIARQELQSV